MIEKDLFNLLKINTITDLEKTENKYEYYDCYSEKYDMFIELKCRRTHYPTLLIEKSKYEKLIKNKHCRYICSTPIGIYSFNLHTLPTPIWTKELLPSTTDFNNNEYILKDISYLSIENGINISESLLN